MQPLWNLSPRVRRALLLAPPLVLAVFTVLHPQPEMNTEAMMDDATWFAAYHVIQLPLAALVTVSVVLLADTFGRSGAWQTVVGVGLFLTFFSAYDTLAGIGTGLAMRGARDLSASQQDGVFSIVREWPMFDPVAFSLSIIGTLGWVLAVGSLALTARRAGAPRSQWMLIALAALFLLVGHPAPFGTIAFGSLFLAALASDRRQKPLTTG